MSIFEDKFSEFSEGRFAYLRLCEVNVHIAEGSLEFCFVCPESHFQQTLAVQSEIERAVEQAFKTSLQVVVRVRKSHFDPHFFTRDVIGFFGRFASLKGCVTKRSFSFCEEKDGHRVTVSLRSIAFGVFESRKLGRKLMEFVRNNYCESVEVEVVDSGEQEELPEELPEAYSFDNKSGRCIQVTQSEGLIGFTIFDLPSYICDAAPAELATLCGKIEQLKEIERKPKDGVHKPSFYKFCLNDTTGTINCVYFPTDKTKGKFSCLSEGTEIVAQGKLEVNTFNDQSTLTFYIKRVSYCRLPENVTINRLKLNVPSTYKNVFPLAYSEQFQTSFAAGSDLIEDSAITANKDANEFLRGQEFCVFDIETTGLDRLNDKIIEIGAVRVVGGRLKETFSVLIDPQTVLPDRIKRLTGITEADLKDALLIDEVLPDLLKFLDGSVLVGHNLEQFDYPFLANMARKHSIYFDNKRLDTYTLARNYLKLKQYRLRDLAEYYDVVNPNAHRALDDAVTTAKIFIKMSHLFDFEI